MHTTTQTITPEQAALWLVVNLHNRRLSRVAVNRYADAIRSDSWVVNGEAIKIGKSGELLDGQHRLAACVLADKAFTSLVAYEVDDAVFPTLDSGRNRTVGDGLDITGELNAPSLGAALKMISRYETGSIGSCEKLTTPEAFEVLRRHPSVRESVVAVKGYPRNIRSRVITFINYMGSLLDRHKTAEFMLKLKHGENMRSGDPALLLRNRLLAGTVLIGGGSPGEVQSVALCIKALNASLEDKSISVLRYSTKHEFPSVIGFPYGQPIQPQV